MPQKTVIDVTVVWLVTGLANVLNFFLEDFSLYLPIVQNILAIISLLLAIAYTAYKFAKSWTGWNPRKKK